MKKLLCCVVNILIFSQENDKKFTIQTSPFSYVLDLIYIGEGTTRFIMDLEGQYKINENINVSLTLSFFVDNDYYVNNFQINIKPMFVYRPFGTGLKGFYIGIYPNIGWQTYKEYLWTEIGIGINTGYKWILNNGFTIQLGTGIGKTWSIHEEKPYYIGHINSDGSIPLKNFDFHILDFKLGYSF